MNATVKPCPCGAITITRRGDDALIWYEHEGRVTDYTDGTACPECGWSPRHSPQPRGVRKLDPRGQSVV